MVETFYAVLELKLLMAIGITALGGLMLGYCGWGGAMVSMPLLVFLYGPVEALAIMVVGYFILLVSLVRSAIFTVDWHVMKYLLVSIVLLVPVGNLFLFLLDPILIRRAIGFIICFFSILILFGWRYRGPFGGIPSAATGAISGFINGFIGLGGPPLVIYLMATDKEADVQRACILVGMTLLTGMVIITLTVQGGFNLETVYRGLMTTPLQWVGGAIGAWLFSRIPSEFSKKFTISALIFLGISVALF